MKVIHDALLYNKIECYNKGVQRSPSRSVKGCTHSSRHLHRSRYKMFGRAPKRDPSSSSTKSYHSWSVLSRSSTGHIMMHDVNIEEAHR